MEIRPFSPQDAQDASSLIEACFISVDLGGHTKKGIQIQLEANSPEHLIENSRVVKYFVAVRRGEVVGICGHDREKVRTLFVKRDCQGEGVGGKLLTVVLEHAKAEGINEIRTWSTHFAVNFYEHFGFHTVRDINLPEGSKDIGLVEMTKTL